jgi:SAM-dependent methyltransferase
MDGCPSQPSKDGWTSVSTKKIFIMTQTQKIYNIIADTDKNYDPYYSVLPELIKKLDYKIGIEIGVFCGGHASKILEAGTEMLIGIDPYHLYEPGMPCLETQEDWDILCNIVNHRLKETNYIHFRMTSDEFMNRLDEGDKDYDFIFIDGLHTADQLSKDLQNYSSLIRQGGVIACHDYNHPFFPELTGVIDTFVKENNKKLHIGPLHLVYWFQ